MALRNGAWGHIVGFGASIAVVALWPPWPEAFALPKVMIVTALGFACIPLIWSRRQAITRSKAPVILLASFLALALLSQLLSGAPQALSLWGDWSRRTGTLTVLSLFLIFLAGVVLSRREARTVLAWIAWSGLPVTTYGIVQAVGRDPLPWNNPGGINSTLGNPNFTAAALVMLALITAGLALYGGFARAWRVLMGLLAATEVLVAVATGSSQAVFALAAGVGTGLMLWVFRWSNTTRARAAAGVTVILAIGAALTLVGILGTGPLASLVSPDTLGIRLWYWQAGVEMAIDHPLLGVGPDGFGRFYLEYRPVDAADLLTVTSNAAHNVPLQWASTLGLPAAAVYIALVLTTVVIVLRRMWFQQATGAQLIIPVAAVWVAYQTQSMVSIDAPALALLGWLSWGLLFSLSDPREIASSGTSPRAWAAAALLAVVGLLAWLPPLLASNASRTIVSGTSEQDVGQAIQLIEGPLLPCEPALGVAQWLIRVAPTQPTVDALFARAKTDARCQGILVAAVDVALQLKQGDLGLEFAEQAVDADPLNYYRWIDLARAQHAADEDEGAVRSLERALELAPSAADDIQEVAEDLALPAPVDLARS